MLGLVFRRGRFVLVLTSVCMLLLGVIFVGFYAGLRPDRNLPGIVKLVPSLIRGFLGGQHLDLTSPAGFLAMSYKHPIVLLTLCAALITPASRGLAGEIAAGTVDLLLTHPVRRRTVVAANAALLLVTSVVLPFVLFAGHNLGLVLFPLELEGYAELFFPVAVNLVLFSVFTGGLALLVSAATSVRGRAVGVTIGIIGACLFVDLGAGAWSKIAWLNAFTPFGYLEPSRAVALRQFALADLACLAAGAIAIHAAATAVFTRRQIP
jgi:ABC-2 type transport system permease protein